MAPTGSEGASFHRSDHAADVGERSFRRIVGQSFPKLRDVQLTVTLKVQLPKHLSHSRQSSYLPKTNWTKTAHSTYGKTSCRNAHCQGRVGTMSTSLQMPHPTIWVISESVLTANYLTDADKIQKNIQLIQLNSPWNIIKQQANPDFVAKLSGYSKL